MKKTISVVVSVYNEENNIDNFFREIMPVLKNMSRDCELVFVNDGSVDKSADIINRLCEKNKKIKAVHLSKNFGHEAAMLAGIDYATGDAIVCMDCDSQHPPRCLYEIEKALDDGFEVVCMARLSRKDGGVFREVASGIFYKILEKISPYSFLKNFSDFFALGKNAADVLKKEYRENVRCIRGFVQNMGFKKTVIEYFAPERFSGKSKYGFKKLFSLSLDVLTSFSPAPLHLGFYAAAALFTLSLVLAAIGFSTGRQIFSLLWSVFFCASVILMCLGFMGQYLWTAVKEIKGRPIYTVSSVKNLPDGEEK